MGALLMDYTIVDKIFLNNPHEKAGSTGCFLVINTVDVSVPAGVISLYGNN